MTHSKRRTPAGVFLLLPSMALLLLTNPGVAQTSSSFEDLAWRVEQSTDSEEAYRLAHELLGMAEASENSLELVQAYVRLSRISYLLNEPAETIRYADLGLALEDGVEASPSDKQALLHFKALALERMGDVEGARASGFQALQLAKESGDPFPILQSTQFLANLHGKLGEHTLALQYHLESLELFGMDETLPRLQVLNNVILLLTRMGDLDRALTYSDQAETVRQDAQEPTPEFRLTSASLLLNRANILRLRGDFQGQLLVLEEADALIQDFPEADTRILITAALADAYLNLGDFPQAAEYSRRAMANTDLESSPFPHAIAMANLGLALIGSGDRAQGIGYLAGSRDALERIQARAEALEVQGLLAEAYEDSGDYEAAATEYRRFKEAADAFRQEQAQAQLTDAQAKFEVTLAQKEVDLLEAERKVQTLAIARQRYFFYAAVLGMAGIAVILGLTWNRYRLKTEAYEALSVAHAELDKALDEVKTLQGMIPICANCKNIRDDQGLWSRIETYISQHSDTQFSHTFCPDCARELYPDLVEGLELK